MGVSKPLKWRETVADVILGIGMAGAIMSLYVGVKLSHSVYGQESED